MIIYATMNLPVAVWMMRSFLAEVPREIARVPTSTVAGTAPVLLTGFIAGEGLFPARLCAASLVVSLPVLIAGFAAQDKLVHGLSTGAVK